jgi:hypothetical protein
MSIEVLKIVHKPKNGLAKWTRSESAKAKWKHKLENRDKDYTKFHHCGQFKVVRLIKTQCYNRYICKVCNKSWIVEFKNYHYGWEKVKAYRKELDSQYVACGW